MSGAPRRGRRAAAIVALAFLVSTVSIVLGTFAELEDKTWDWRLRWVASHSAHDPKIKLVMIDQTSLEYFAENDKLYWPWPRSLYNPVLLFLQKGGARAVAFDMLFTELSCHYDDDQKFAEMVEQGMPVVSAVAPRSNGAEYNHEMYREFSAKQGGQREFLSGYLTSLHAPRYEHAALPIADLMRTSAALGSVTAYADSDKIFRRASAGAFIKDTPLLSLPFALKDIVEPGPSGWREVQEFADSQGRFLVRFHGPEGTYESYSIHALIASWLQIARGEKPLVSPEEFKDAIVLIGANATGLLDMRPTPFGVNYSGVEFNATVLDNLLHRSFMREVSLPFILKALLGLLVIAAWMCIRLSRFQLPILGFLGALWVVFCFWMAQLGWWVPLVVPLVAMGVVALAILVLQYQIEGRQHRFIRNAFKYYVSPEVIHKIVLNPQALSLGGERRDLTIFFSDIAGFTAMSERMKPDQLVRLLNRILSEVSDLILSEGGTIDKYQGDAVIAFWNAPLPLPNHPDLAIRAALQCQRRLRFLAPTLKQEFGVDISMRIGLHTGEVAVGNFGSSSRFNYTIVGDAANLTSRLEGFNKVFGSSIMVSRSTKERAGAGILWRRLGAVKVTGREQIVEVFEPLDAEHQRGVIDRLNEFHLAQGLYEQERFEEAAALFSSFPDDPVSQTYLKRCKECCAHPDRFSTVWSSKEK